jgi:light-regulated signal transduction histidine kinase (bacteriophytochrome)
MRLENETHELEVIAKAIRIISKGPTYEGLAKARLREALSYSGAARGGVLKCHRRSSVRKDRRHWMGIDSKRRNHLFDVLCTTKAVGLGLGLSISRKMIMIHGGHLWAKETTMHRATFVFTLPLR